jgi:hypothetical protein
VWEKLELYYPFDAAFHEQVSPGIFTLLETDGFLKLYIGIESGSANILDELCMAYFICEAVFSFFRSGSGIASWTQRTVA